MTIDDLTPAERAFVDRMAHHVAKGLSFDAAARAVLTDDERLFAAFCDRSEAHYVPTPDERGSSYRTGERPGDLIRREMSRQVYARIKGRRA
jgi:hypothetical protein